MRVFLSWSGGVSHGLAELLYWWLPSVVQAVKPWMSSEDVPPGTFWAADMTNQLNAATAGIICVSRQNVGAPWLNFEAGALAKQLDKPRVAVALLGVRPADLAGPLTLFHNTAIDNDRDVFRMVRMLNEACPEPLARVSGIS